MSSITRLRNKIRIKFESDIDPIVDYNALYRASQIDASIRAWQSAWPIGEARHIAGLLYKQMLWVYLWRSIYPPRATRWAPNTKITAAVNGALELLRLIPANDPCQTVLLTPTFIIGCAAFEPEQRIPIRESIRRIKAYTTFRNADRALEVLEEVWRYMDKRDKRSWDWQRIASDMGMDFLATYVPQGQQAPGMPIPPGMPGYPPDAFYSMARAFADSLFANTRQNPDQSVGKSLVLGVKDRENGRGRYYAYSPRDEIRRDRRFAIVDDEFQRVRQEDIHREEMRRPEMEARREEARRLEMGIRLEQELRDFESRSRAPTETIRPGNRDKRISELCARENLPRHITVKKTWIVTYAGRAVETLAKSLIEAYLLGFIPDMSIDMPCLLYQLKLAPSTMSLDAEVVVYHRYCPTGVKRVIATGTSAFIGELDESTVLKYPLSPTGDVSRLDIERKLLQIRTLLGARREWELGLLSARIGQSDPFDPAPSIQQQLSWCREAAEAVSYVHSKRVLHCDIQPTNFLLDVELHLKLSDFQGKLLSEQGEVLLDGGSGEPCRFYLPRDDPFEADIKTDLFALGCTLYFIMMGHAVFPDIIDGADGWHDEVVDRFTNQQFPQDIHACSSVTLKCWLQQYDSAEDIVQEISFIERNIATADDVRQGRGRRGDGGESKHIDDSSASATTGLAARNPWDDIINGGAAISVDCYSAYSCSGVRIVSRTPLRVAIIMTTSLESKEPPSQFLSVL
ncbi:hypothetical protein V498_09581 [Pseudogymnoascus sp. VKM F-4517 (FW-2822)]|nr:hypothetical protein V498_09581 [Pseudogymnoascus sp. VKM F-4517 (FW-2822)]